MLVWFRLWWLWQPKWRGQRDWWEFHTRFKLERGIKLKKLSSSRALVGSLWFLRAIDFKNSLCYKSFPEKLHSHRHHHHHHRYLIRLANFFILKRLSALLELLHGCRVLNLKLEAYSLKVKHFRNSRLRNLSFFGCSNSHSSSWLHIWHHQIAWKSKETGDLLNLSLLSASLRIVCDAKRFVPSLIYASR